MLLLAKVLSDLLMDILLYAPSPDGEFPTSTNYKQISDGVTVVHIEFRALQILFTLSSQLSTS